MKFSKKKNYIFIILIVLLILLFLKNNNVDFFIDKEKIISTHKFNDDFLVNIKINNNIGGYDLKNNVLYFSGDNVIMNDIEIISPYDTKYFIEKISDNLYEIFVYTDLYYCIKTISFISMPIINISTYVNLIDFNEKLYQKYNLTSSDALIFGSNFKNLSEDKELDVSVNIYNDYKTNYGTSWDIINSLGTMKVRGSTSKLYEKKSYKLKVDKEYAINGLEKDDDWILDSLYADKSKIRNKLSSDVWNLINNNQIINNDLSCKFVELFIDNDYQGLYVLKNNVDKKTVAISNEGILVKFIDHFDDIQLDNLIYNNFSVVENIFLNMEIKKNYNNFNEFVFKLRNYYLNENSFDNISRTFYFDNYINYKVLASIFYAGDNISKNQYYSMNSKDASILITPWDMDLTWGLEWDNTAKLYNSFSLNSYSNSKWLDDNITNSMDLETLDALKKRYWELRKNVITMDTINSYLDSYKELLIGSGAAKRDSERWYNYDIDFEIEQIREWANNRIIFLDEYFNM